MKKTETKSTVLLAHHLKSLRLPTILAECEKVAAQCATDNVDHLAFLLQLCELELLDRERRASDRRLKAAKFPNYKTLDTFDFKSQPSLNKVLIYRTDSRRIHRQEGERAAGRELGNRKKHTSRRRWESQPVLRVNESDSIALQNSSLS